ncbi:MAG: hypothetical protein HY015_07450 [Bacteroidetes bacterium]|nr:hypothetical protein [Bacteroidota bacterium]MBI3482797.1 hypothetical protein [Bacteroidota bacterium]
MKKLFLGFFSLLLVLSITPDSVGQFNRRTIKKNNKRIASFTGKKKFSREHVYSGVGFSLNALNYYGDLSPLPSKFSTDISFTKPAFGISLFHRFGPRYTLVGQFMYGSLKGADAESAKGSDGDFRKVRNLSFRNRIKELSINFVFDLFENNGTYISRVKWTPYAFVGFAAFLHSPQAQEPAKFLDGTVNKDAGKWVDLQSLGTEGQHSTLQPGDANYGIKPYSLLQVAIPFGVGGRFRLNEVLDLWADIGFRYTFTDYLDDVSQNYVDLGVFTDPLAQAMSYRSNEVATSTATYVGRDGKTYNVVNGYGSEFRDNWRGHKSSRDIYMVTSVKITYILGATFHRAKFR